MKEAGPKGPPAGARSRRGPAPGWWPRARALGNRLFHRPLESEIVVEASPDRVWRVLTEFSAYPDWNPFISWVSGEARPGGPLRAVALPARGPGFAFSAWVTAARPARELSWTGQLVFPWLFHGHHYFLIEERPGGGTLLRHGEVLGGLLVPLLGAVMAAWMLPGFSRMNQALKARAEMPSGPGRAGTPGREE
jgi:hypothetical protein